MRRPGAVLAALRRCLDGMFHAHRPVATRRPAEAAAPAAPDAADAREKLMATLAWGVAEGAITQEQAGEELSRFDAEQHAKGALP